MLDKIPASLQTWKRGAFSMKGPKESTCLDSPTTSCSPRGCRSSAGQFNHRISIFPSYKFTHKKKKKNQLTTSVVDYKSTIYIVNYYIFNKWYAGKEADKI